MSPTQLLGYLVHGPWQDPEGFSFPQTRQFGADALLPPLIPGTRLTLGARVRAAGGAVRQRVAAAARWPATGCAWWGWRPDAARYAGFSQPGAVWLGLLLSGGLAGLAGVCEVAGPIGQLTPVISPGYGFAAIIVAFLGRLQPGRHPARQPADGAALSRRRAAADLAAVADRRHRRGAGLLLFFLLAADVLVEFRVRLVAQRRRRSAMLDGHFDATALLVGVVVATLRAATPLLLAGFGELVTERAGVLNLGVEGMMLVGAAAGFIGAVDHRQRRSRGLALAVLAGVAMALIFGLLTLYLMANQVATGLALTIFGIGLSALLGVDYVGKPIPGIATRIFPQLAHAPPVEQQLMLLDPVGWVALLAPLAVSCVPVSDPGRPGAALGRRIARGRRTRSATTVLRIRLAAVLFGGAMSGLAGAIAQPGLHADVDREHDRRARLDRARAGGVLDLEAAAGCCSARCCSASSPSPSSRPRRSASTCRRTCWPCCRTSPPSSCWC